MPVGFGALTSGLPGQWKQPHRLLPPLSIPLDAQDRGTDGPAGSAYPSVCPRGSLGGAVSLPAGTGGPAALKCGLQQLAAALSGCSISEWIFGRVLQRRRHAALPIVNHCNPPVLLFSPQVRSSLGQAGDLATETAALLSMEQVQDDDQFTPEVGVDSIPGAAKPCLWRACACVAQSERRVRLLRRRVVGLGSLLSAAGCWSTLCAAGAGVSAAHALEHQ